MKSKIDTVHAFAVSPRAPAECSVNIPTIPLIRKDCDDIINNITCELVSKVNGMPTIGKADHDIMYVEYNIKAKQIQHAQRKIFLYKRVGMEGLPDHLA